MLYRHRALQAHMEWGRKAGPYYRDQEPRLGLPRPSPYSILNVLPCTALAYCIGLSVVFRMQGQLRSHAHAGTQSQLAPSSAASILLSSTDAAK